MSGENDPLANEYKGSFSIDEIKQAAHEGAVVKRIFLEGNGQLDHYVVAMADGSLSAFVASEEEEKMLEGLDIPAVVDEKADVPAKNLILRTMVARTIEEIRLSYDQSKDMLL